MAGPTAGSARGLPLPVRLTPPERTGRTGGASPVARGPVRPGAGAAPARTGVATASLVLGLLALVLDGLLLLPTILAVVLGIVALAKGSPARARAVAGIVLGLVGVVVLAIEAAVAVPVLLAVQGEARATLIESRLTSATASGAHPLTGVDCPAVPRPAAGGTVVCSGEAAGAGPVRLAVTFTDAAGAFTVRAIPAG